MSKKIIGVTVGTPTSVSRIGRDLKPEIKKYIDEQIGEIDAALDGVVAIQELLINGVSFRIQYPMAGIQDEFSVAYGTTWGEWAATPEGAELVYDDGGYLLGMWTDEKVRNSNGEVQTPSSVILPDQYSIHS